MGLPGRQRKVLDTIETALRGSDPKLVALYAMFARLTAGETIPGFEQLRYTARMLLGGLLRGFGRWIRRAFGMLDLRRRAAIMFPLALVAAIITVVFTVRVSPGSSCTAVSPVATGPKHLAKRTLCLTPPTPTTPGK